MDQDYIKMRQLTRVILVNFQSNQGLFNNTKNSNTMSFISILNKFSLYFLCVICTVSNLFLMISFKLRKNKKIHKYSQPCYCLCNQLSFLFFVLGSFQLNEQPNLIHYSRYSYKIFTFLTKLTSTLTNWILAYGIFVLRCQVRQNNSVLDRNQRFLYFLPIILAFVYSGDLYFLDLLTITFDNISHNQTHNNFIDLCGFDNFYLVLLMDFIDLIAFVFFPLLFIFFNVLFLKTPDNIIPKLKVLCPLLFALFCMPICLVVIFRDYQIKFEKKISYLVELFFTLFIILNQTFNLIILLIHILLSEHSRILFKSFFCFECIKCKFISIEIRRNSSNDVLNLKEIQRLNLNDFS